MKYTNISQYKGPLKYTHIGTFGLKRYRLATLFHERLTSQVGGDRLEVESLQVDVLDDWRRQPLRVLLDLDQQRFQPSRFDLRTVFTT
jgi:hypothetical protein